MSFDEIFDLTAGWSVFSFFIIITQTTMLSKYEYGGGAYLLAEPATCEKKNGTWYRSILYLPGLQVLDENI